eukprot:406223-Prymnesium_polylepis.1
MRHAGATLDSICARNADLRRELPTVFDSTIAASVSPGAYMDRLRKLTEFEEAIFLVALTFIGERLLRYRPPRYLSQRRPRHGSHRLLARRPSLSVQRRRPPDALQHPPPHPHRTLRRIQGCVGQVPLQRSDGKHRWPRAAGAQQARAPAVHPARVEAAPVRGRV